VLGDYLDRNSADDFAISLSKYSTKIRYGGKEQIFTAQNLYDLGILMYLRHSKRASGKQGRPATATGSSSEEVFGKQFAGIRRLPD
jgi:hypothetical protein